MKPTIPNSFLSFTDLATRPIQNAFNIDGVTNAGRGVIDAQMAFLDALTRPLFTAGDRLVNVNRELLGIVSSNSHYLNFGLNSNYFDILGFRCRKSIWRDYTKCGQTCW